MLVSDDHNLLSSIVESAIGHLWLRGFIHHEGSQLTRSYSLLFFGKDCKAHVVVVVVVPTCEKWQDL